MTLNITTICHYAKCCKVECNNYAECRYAECHCAECRGAFKVLYVATKRRCLTEQGCMQSKGLGENLKVTWAEFST